MENITNKTGVRDVFIYLFILVSLITSVWNIITIVFAAIDKKFPDIINGANDYYYLADSLRMAVSVVVVVFPIYVYLSFLATKDIEKNESKKELRIRKFSVYGAIFITICSIIGTLISVIYNYLGGELTARFGLKALFILILSLAVFGYYYFLSKRDYTKKTNTGKIFAGVVSLFVLVCLVVSISITGTPNEVRKMKLDDQRLTGISTIQQEVFNYVAIKYTLPKDLSELTFANGTVPVDPVTNESYVYKIKSEGSYIIVDVKGSKKLVSPTIFEVCANFDTVRELTGTVGGVVTTPVSIPVKGDYRWQYENYYPGNISVYWNHGIGETCFERKISDDMIVKN